jgi:hypothetical protein
MKTGQVFVSHTSDMAHFPAGRSFVQAALDAIGRARMAPVEMRYFPAQDVDPADYCRKRVRQCEIYVMVVGFRYGSTVPGTDISHTEMEFRAAGNAGLPRLVFLLEEASCPPGMADTQHGVAEAFRERLHSSGLIVRSFASAEGLELEIFHALSELGSGRTVPRIWNVPNRNVDFTGREALLDKLHRELREDGTVLVSARALYGLGGVGKTQVAVEYAYRYQADYDLVWWIPSEQPQWISMALAALARKLGLHVGDNAAEAAADALEYLRRAAGRWLLIFDNVNEPQDLNSYSFGGLGHVVITSRNHAWPQRAVPLEVEPFTTAESVAHLIRHVPGLEARDAEEISHAMGDLPLAIEQAAAWLAETGMPPAFYIKRLKTHITSMLAVNKPADYALPVDATWNLSLERLKQRSPAAVCLLQILAFCSSEAISLTLLYGNAMIEQMLPLDETLRDELLLGRLIKAISRFALVKIDQRNNSLQIHRLVQAVICSHMTPEEQLAACHQVHQILIAARPDQGETDDPANWSTYDIIWPHLEPSKAAECGDSRTRQLLIDWVRYQWARGELDSSLNLSSSLERLWNEQLGADHEQTLHLQFQKANILRSMGRFSESRDLDAYVLERQRAVLGPNHKHALMTAGGLGADLRALGEYQQALSLSEDTRERWSDQFGEDYEWTLAATHNLACSLRLVGDCYTACRFDRDTLTRQQIVLTPNHPKTLLSEASLAHDLREAGAFLESVERLRVTYDIFRKAVGEEMLDTLRTGNSLSISLRRLGTLDEAINLAQSVYSRYVKRYGRLAPDALSCGLNLACCYAATGDTTKALQLTTEIEAVYRTSLGEEHPYALVAASNSVIYLLRMGDVAHARLLGNQTLALMHSTLGDDHPFSLSCAVNLANCLAAAGDVTQAETLERQTLRGLREKFDRLHPDMLACESNLAITVSQAGRVDEAEQARVRVLHAFSQVLDADHPDLMLARDWHRIDRELDPLPI